MAKEVLITLNEKAGDSPLWLIALKSLREQFSYVTITSSHLEDLDSQRVKKSSHWLVLGGDGTLNNVTNALMRFPKEERCKVCYLPFGTGNDFARTLGLGEQDSTLLFEEAFQENAEYAPISVGRCNSQFFLNMATGGMFATITPEASSQLKSVAGRWSYFIHGLGKLMERQTFSLQVDGGPPHLVLGFFVGNARYAGGGIQVTSTADPFEPKLEFLLLPDMPTAELLALGLELQKESPDTSTFPVRSLKVEKLNLSFSQPTPINLDGEQITVNTAAFSVFPEALQIFVPKPAAVF